MDDFPWKRGDRWYAETVMRKRPPGRRGAGKGKNRGRNRSSVSPDGGHLGAIAGRTEGSRQARGRGIDFGERGLDTANLLSTPQGEKTGKEKGSQVEERGRLFSFE